MPLRRPRFASEATKLIERLRGLDAKAIASLIPIAGEGVLIELVQAPPEVVAALGA